MAVDSMLYQVSFPAGTYAAGAKGSLTLIRGPSVVRDGCGTPRLVKIFTAANASGLNPVVHIKNAQWNDEIINPAPVMTDTALSKHAVTMQKGGDLELVKNSSFDVTYELLEAATTTAPVDVVCQIDIDYDAYPSVKDPYDESGFPMSIELGETITATAIGAPLTFDTFNVDIFKAGYKYLLTGAYFDSMGVASVLGFISITGAAGQGGLERLIPVFPSVSGIRYDLDASTPLMKGPMNINLGVFAAANVTADVQFDFIRR